MHLGILDQGEVVYLDRVTTTRVSLPTRVGGRAPAYCTALGKVMLAFADPASQASALTGMRRRTEFTVTDPRAIQSALDSAKQPASPTTAKRPTRAWAASRHPFAAAPGSSGRSR